MKQIFIFFLIKNEENEALVIISVSVMLCCSFLLLFFFNLGFNSLANEIFFFILNFPSFLYAQMAQLKLTGKFASRLAYRPQQY